MRGYQFTDPRLSREGLQARDVGSRGGTVYDSSSLSITHDITPLGVDFFGNPVAMPDIDTIATDGSGSRRGTVLLIARCRRFTTASRIRLAAAVAAIRAVSVARTAPTATVGAAMTCAAISTRAAPLPAISRARWACRQRNGQGAKDQEKHDRDLSTGVDNGLLRAKHLPPAYGQATAGHSLSSALRPLPAFWRDHSPIM
ncbi:hypothetical protein NCHU2750_47590 (plasmid) [Neorhizobium sp. NCHU2750]|nr:hypothetical protein NCHU2750_47590 [Neorhizobium sp. NCHU2750]